MIFFLSFIVFICLAVVAALLIEAKNQGKRATEAQEKMEQMRQHYESEKNRVYSEARHALGESQKLVDQESEHLKQEAVQIRQHYLGEARKAQQSANDIVDRLTRELESLRKYQNLANAEFDVRKQIYDALMEVSGMRSEAKSLLEQSRLAANEDRNQALQKVRGIHEQADARLDQAIRDAGRIIAEAEKQAQQTAGDAYVALRDQRTLEQAAHAMRNIVEGYGDRYLVPTHSLLDDLAAEYSYDAAGQSLAAAREQSKRMVEQQSAATCDYVDENRRDTAIRFVIHAFNGSVDAILSRAKSDNYGVLEQKIRDIFSIVNLGGSAFENVRILQTYLDARLSELKWAVVVQELAARDREEQRYLREQERDRQKAEQERLKQLREAEKEKEIKQAALNEAQSRLAEARAEERAAFEKEVQRLRDELADATRRELTIAQQTTKGRIYVVSNVGSFGDGVYKIGLTRRDAQERVDELSGASVPFAFDIHAVIETDDAPALEYKIHRQFHQSRINKINLRKEFFRISLDDIQKTMTNFEHGKDFNGTVAWTEKAKAQQYYDSLDIDRDPAAREKWLQRTRLLAERQRRNEASVIAAVSDQNEDSVDVETTAPAAPSPADESFAQPT